MESPEIPARALEQALKVGHQAVVGGLQRQRGVVGAGHPGVVAAKAGPGPGLMGFEGGKLGPHRGQQFGLFLALAGLGQGLLGRGLGRTASVHGLQRAAGAPGDRAEVRQALHGGRVLGQCAAVGPPLRHAQTFHCCGVRLVEHRVAGCVGHLVRQLMEHQPGQAGLAAFDKGVEQGVATQPVGPTQGAVGRHTVDRGLQAGSALHGGLGLGIFTLEKTPVADTAQQRVTPGLELE